MSLPRASYLESWEFDPNRPRARLPPSRTDTDGDESIENLSSFVNELPESVLSSSFPSTYSRRLSFNPYSGPGWREGSVERSSGDQHDDGVRTEELEPPAALLKEPDWDVPLTTGAFEVARRKRIAQVCIAVVYCFLGAGIVFGFAAIKPVLIQEGVYRHLCSDEEINDGVNVCYGQEIRLNLMFTIAAVATNVSALPIGTILDNYGPRVCGIIGSVCLAMGAILIAFANSLPFDAYILGYLFLSLGGPFVFISSFHLSNTFPTRSGLILSTLTGAFDASSALFLIFRLANEKTGGAFSTRTFFTLYLVVPLFVFVAQVLVMPTTSYKTAGELVQEAEATIADEANDRVDESIADPREGERQRNDRRLKRRSIVSQIQDLLDDRGTDNEDNGNENIDYYNKVKGYLFRGENDKTTNIATGFGESGDGPPPQQRQQQKAVIYTSGGIWGVLHGYPAVYQILTLWFFLITAFTVLQMLRINYFVASINQQYTYLLSSSRKAKEINQLFDFLLPLGGLASVPFIGIILDNVATPLVLLILVATATLIGILGCIPHSMIAAYGKIAVFVLYRPFYYTAVSDYAAKVFGFQTFGKVYGLIICTAGLGNFLQAGLDAVTFKVFDRNPIPVNAFLTISGLVVGGWLVGFVSWKAMAISKATASGNYGEIEAGSSGDGVARRDLETESLLPRGRPGGSDRHEGSSGYGGVGGTGRN